MTLRRSSERLYLIRKKMKFLDKLTRKLPVDTTKIEQAIAELEQQTSAELRVVIERKAKTKNAIARAEQLFKELEMQNTISRNGVLIYLAFKPHLLAVIGDEGIHQKVNEQFWECVYQSMKNECKNANYTHAICQGITQVSEQLSQYFPRTDDDRNELSNEVVIK